MKFTDETEISVKAGDGGDGLISFRSAYRAPRLGPDGGDGGEGGHVVFVATERLASLSHLRYKKMYRAEDGVKGGPNQKTGRRGVDLEIEVPVGTVVYEDQKVTAELLENQQKVVIAFGGIHGKGNARFTKAHRQAPDFSTAGTQGEEKHLRLELKLIADIGLVGEPNAGKSTLLSVLTTAKPKIAEYPFSTLQPQLGVVELGDKWSGQSFVVADIPGLVEDAHKGKGLGVKFLKHIERCRAIAYVVDGSSPDEKPSEIFAKLKNELESFKFHLAHLNCVLIITKKDIWSEDPMTPDEMEFFRTRQIPCLSVSAATLDGIKELKFLLLKLAKDDKS